MGKQWKQWTEFSFLGSKITAEGDWSHEIKRHLLLERKAMTNLDSVLKSRDIALPTEVCEVKAMVFPVVMYGCESWKIKKAECLRIDAFQLWCWRRLLKAPWTASRSNQFILKEVNPEHSLEGLMLTLKLQYFGHLIWRAKSLEKTLLLGKIEGARRRGQWRMRWLMASLTHWTWVWAKSRRWWRMGKPGMLQSMGLQRIGYDWATEQQQQPTPGFFPGEFHEQRSLVGYSSRGCNRVGHNLVIQQQGSAKGLTIILETRFSMCEFEEGIQTFRP